MNAFMEPTVKMDDGFYKDAAEKKVSAFKLLGTMDPSPVQHVDAIYQEKLLELGIDPTKRGGTAKALRDWSKGQAALERQLAQDDKFVAAGGLAHGKIKDFQTVTGNLAVFPIWIDSMIQMGLLKVGYVQDLIFGTEEVDSPNVTAVTLSDVEGDRSLIETAMGAELREVTAVLGSGSITLAKFGRAFKAPYEIVGLRTIDVVGTMLQRLGQQIAIDETDEALNVLVGGDGTTLGAAESDSTDIDGSGTPAYSEMVQSMLNADEPYMPTTVVTDTDGIRRTANLAEFKDPDVARAAAAVDFPTPLALRWIRFSAATGSSYATGMQLYVDTRHALKQLRWGPTIEETDKIILSQSNIWTFSYYSGFQKWDADAITVYDWLGTAL